MRPLLLLVVAVPLAASGQGFRAVSTEPLANVIDAAPDAVVAVGFANRVDPTTITDSTFQVFGRWSGVATGARHVSSTGLHIILAPERPFFAGERVTVTLTQGIRSHDGDSLAGGFAFQFWVRTMPALPFYREVSRVPIRDDAKEDWIQSYGAYAGDLDGDGWSDLAVMNERTNDARVFLNDGTGRYDSRVHYSLTLADRPSPSEGLDLDLDGDTDIVAGSAQAGVVSILLNQVNGILAPAGFTQVGLTVRGLTVLDYDADGFPDVAVADRDGGTVSILRGQGNGRLVPVRTMDTGADQETAIEAADMNGDGIMDLVVGALGSREIVVLEGDANGVFTVSERVPVGGATWMIATGDLNGDGRIDVASANSTTNNLSLLLQTDSGLSDPIVYPTGDFPLAVDMGDIDGDGDLDVVTSEFGGVSWSVFTNDGSGRLTLTQVLPASAAGSCVILHDRNNDGVLDISAIDELDDRLFLFANDGAVGTEQLPARQSAVYPNPFSDHLSFAAEPGQLVRLIDPLGRVVGHRIATRFRNGWELPAGLSTGAYLLQVGPQTYPLIRIR